MHIVSERDRVVLILLINVCMYDFHRHGITTSYGERSISSRVFGYGLCYVIVKSKLYMHERSLKKHLMKQILD